MLDITGVDLRIVARKQTPAASDGDSGNLIMTAAAILAEPEQGYAYFDIQADSLNWAPGEYEFAIVMVANGYSSVIVKGVIDLVQNTEFSSMDDTFSGFAQAGEALTILLEEQHAITVYAGYALAPGTTSFTDADKEHLDALWSQGWDVLANKPQFGTAAFVNVEDIALPPGGSPGSVLTKSTAVDYETHWAQVAEGGTGLDATGQPAGNVPIATGFDTWDWGLIAVPVLSVNGKVGAIILTADDINETGTRTFLTEEQRDKLAAFSPIPSYNDLADLPTLGTAAAQDVSYFLVSTDMISNAIIPKVTGLRGTSRGTAAPAGGVDGDQYRQYVP